MKTLILTLITILLLNGVVEAKCAPDEYHLFGKVESLDHSPISGAKIYIFFDEYQSTSYIHIFSDFALTNSKGSFGSVNYFDNLSSWKYSLLDRCNKKPSSVELFVIKDGFQAKRVNYRFSKLRVRNKDVGSFIIVLPDSIKLIKNN